MPLSFLIFISFLVQPFLCPLFCLIPSLDTACAQKALNVVWVRAVRWCGVRPPARSCRPVWRGLAAGLRALLFTHPSPSNSIAGGSSECGVGWGFPGPSFADQSRCLHPPRPQAFPHKRPPQPPRRCFPRETTVVQRGHDSPRSHSQRGAEQGFEHRFHSGTPPPALPPPAPLPAAG